MFFVVHEDCIHFQACQRLYKKALQQHTYIPLECSGGKCPHYISYYEVQYPLTRFIQPAQYRQNLKKSFDERVLNLIWFIKDMKKREFLGGELMQCPECGEEAKIEEVLCGDKIYYIVKCVNSHISRLFKNTASAEKAWNTGKGVLHNPKINMKEGVTICL